MALDGMILVSETLNNIVWVDVMANCPAVLKNHKQLIGTLEKVTLTA